MRDLRRAATILGGLISACGLLAAGLVACSDDDTTVGGGTDASIDQVSVDTGRDGGVDSGMDAAADAPTLFEYPPAMGQAICARILTCCSGGAGADAGVFDGGVFDNAACLKIYGGTGWENSLGGTDVPGVVDGGHLVYNATEANNCLTRLNSGPADGGKFTCGVVGSAEFTGITAACFAAIRGNIPVGSAGCRASIECVPGSYCAPSDGGLGTCTALKAIGVNCDDSAPLGSSAGNDECSYRGSGVACLPPDAGLPRTCAALRANGEDCVTGNEECQSGLCDDNFKCGTNLTLLDPATCKLFVDAGP